MWTKLVAPWLMAGLFACGAFMCLRIVRIGRCRRAKANHAISLLMCLAMIGMVASPSAPSVVLVTQAVVFACCASWWIFQALSASVRLPATVDELPGGATAAGVQLFMLAAMLWMLAVMGGWLGTDLEHQGTIGGSLTEAHPVRAAMSPSGAGMIGHTAHPLPGWARAASWGMVLAFVVSALSPLCPAIGRRARTRPLRRGSGRVLARVVSVSPHLAAHDVVMSAGMAAALAGLA